MPKHNHVPDPEGTMTYDTWYKATEKLQLANERQREALGKFIDHHWHAHPRCSGPSLDPTDLPEVVTLCGSMRRAGPQILEVAQELTLEGIIVLAPFAIKPAGQTETEELMDGLQDLHRWKMAIAKRVIFVTVNGYMGTSTKSELQWCIDHRKPHIVLERSKP